MHFFNPAPVMKLVEIIRTVVTAPEVVADVEALCARLGKVDVTITDRAGFIANALLFGYLNHAVSMLEAHYATREDIDAAMKLGCGLPMGPLALMDLIGLDTAYEILDTMYRRGGRDRRHAPAPLIKQMVTAGLLGRKSGRGFYTYEKPGSPVVVPRRADADRDAPRPRRRPPGREGRCGRRRHRHLGLRRARSRSFDPRRGYERRSRRPRAHRRARRPGPGDVDLGRRGGGSRSSSVKKALFADLDEICKPGVVLATTTSTLPVIECAMATQRPADVVGLHFFNPAPVLALVEVVQHDPHLAGDGRDRARRRRRARQDRRACAPTGPGSSSTRCCSRTSTTRSGCWRRRTRRPTTSTTR